VRRSNRLTLGSPSTALRSVDAQLVAALATLYLVWGSTYLGIKIAVASFPPDLMLAMRCGAAALLLFAILKVRRTPWPTLRQAGGSAVVGLLLLVGGLGNVTTAEALGAPSGLAAVMVATMPLWSSLFLALAGERAGRQELVGMALGLGGVALLSRSSALGAHPAAFALLVVGPLLWAIGSVLSRRLPHAAGGMGSAVQLAAASPVLLALGAVRGERLTHAPSALGVGALAYLVVFGSLVAFSAYVFLLDRRVRPSIATSYAYANPVVAVLLGTLLAGEHLALADLAGTGMIVASVILVVSRRRKRS